MNYSDRYMDRKKIIAAAAAIIAVLAGAIAPDAGAAGKKTSSRKGVVPGVEVLVKRGFPGLKGKNVGLVTNPSGVDRNLRSTVDILFNAPEVNLVALYGPEHGVRGDVYAGGKVNDQTDPATGLPVYSLYGATRKPTPEMLEGVDVMVYDIQDVGARSYTFISTLGLVMEACAEQGIEVVISSGRPWSLLKEIADRMNFSSLSYFSRYVKKHIGLSPAKYRNNYAAD